jgi:hypothetical protein
MVSYKLGKLPAQPFHSLGMLDDYLACKPPEPPPSVAVPPGVVWGMDGNDTYGDCVEAGTDHDIAALKALLSMPADPRPSGPQVVAQYLAETDGQDAGLVISTHLLRWQRSGLFAAPDFGPGPANKIGAFASLPLNSPLALHRAIWLYGVAKIGIECPRSAQEQFGAGQPWTVISTSPIAGGHDIEFVAYDPLYFYAVTWGSIARVTYPFVARYMDEAHAILASEIVEAGHGPGAFPLDTQALLADIGRLAA